jgi:D-beta-D-heptose 7-phosphate kinase/D-beta-D-heptose 1-phosphate adenosyltransferase
MSNALAFQTLLPAFAHARILCVGDVMLDHFVYGAVERISPEAPIPVLRISHETGMPGGAANVARNIAALGARVSLVSVVGADREGETLAALLAATPGIEASLVPSKARPTSLKVRHVAGNQQILRTDREVTTPLDRDEEDRLSALIEAQAATADIIVLSDYAKGVLTPRVIAAACAAAHARGKTVIADPKNADFRRYAGVHVLTPNARELAAATGLPVASDTEAAAAATRALQAHGLKALVVTRSEHGMTLATGEGVRHLPAQAREVFDVSGAGDTVIAALAVALAAGSTLADAAAIANTAGSIVVGKAGTAVVRPDEIAAALRASEMQGTGARVRTRASLLDLVQTWRTRGLTVGFTNGCFDLIHPGHVSLLAQARAQCDRLVVGLNTDASVRRLKGPSRPINTEQARAVVLAALESVDAVVLFDEDTPLDLIHAVRPDVLIKGADYTIETVVGADAVAGWGGRVFLADLTPGQSTTGIVRRMTAPVEKARP